MKTSQRMHEYNMGFTHIGFYPRRRLHSVLLAGLLLASASASAKIHELGLKSNFKISSPNWNHLEGAQIPKGRLARQLFRIRQAQVEKKYESCLSQIKKATKKASDFRHWMLLSKLQCATDLAKNSSKHMAKLRVVINEVESNKALLATGPQAKSLKNIYATSLLALFDFESKNQRQQAFGVLDKLMQVKDLLTREQLSDIYRRAGELAFVEQNLPMASQFFSRSLSKKDSSELRARLAVIQKSLEKSGTPRVSPPRSEAVNVLEVSDQEHKLHQRIKNFLKSGELISAVKDGVRLIEEFPGGIRAQWASERILDVYLTVARKSDPKYLSLKQSLLKSMKQVDGIRMLKWAERLAYYGYYVESIELAQESLSRLKGQPESTSVLDLLAQATLYSGDYSESEKWSEEIVLKHAGTESFRRALLRLGLINLRTEKWTKAASYFERLLALPETKNYELQARYWLWRAQQKINPQESEKFSSELIKRFPLTYYGLRALAETNGQKFKLELNQNQALTIRLWLSDFQFQAWKRYLVLVEAGWFEEAQAELSQLPQPQTPEERVVMAKLWSLTGDHFQAVSQLNIAWTERPELLAMDSLMTAFPAEYRPWLLEQEKRYGVDKNLIWALIRQESTFRESAVSSANAKGLMQLVPPTAHGVVKQLRWKDFDYERDLFDPQKNIRLGSHYLRQMLRAFDNHVPLALAAYNAGIGRMRRWMRGREDFSDLSSTHTSDFKRELWIDELPWSETSFYVKAVLRNYLLYKLLHEGPFTASDPVWKY